MCPSLGDSSSVFLDSHTFPQYCGKPAECPKCRDTPQERRGHALGRRLGLWQDYRGYQARGLKARARCPPNNVSWCIGRVLDACY